jgi:hypothetical protein
VLHCLSQTRNPWRSSANKKADQHANASLRMLEASAPTDDTAV